MPLMRFVAFRELRQGNDSNSGAPHHLRPPLNQNDRRKRLARQSRRVLQLRSDHENFSCPSRKEACEMLYVAGRLNG
jgi:hypothetical protein